jgi:ectoine hydroxylase-related dioxygenase (phytanoyl-CoA dioxygenase family)
MLGFIFMIYDFTLKNGATRFIPGSQGMEAPPAAPSPVPACGSAGSMLVFNGSVWHGHGENETDKPRCSLQGAYIRRTETSGENWPARMHPATSDRISQIVSVAWRITY